MLLHCGAGCRPSRIIRGARSFNRAGPEPSSNLSPADLEGCALRPFFRTDAEAANETGRRALRRRFSG
eukprot:15481868-Alexandrium_andersonii.AAC.1